MARFVNAAEQRWNRSGKPPEKINKLPLGPLPKEYCRYCGLQPFHHQDMAMALTVRNRLAHSFYRRRMALLSSPDGREKVIRELRLAVDLFIQQRDHVYWNLSLVTGENPL